VRAGVAFRSMITSAQRDAVALCGAKKRNGKLCRAFAGQGTKHPGEGTCKFHGGNTPTHDRAAVKRQARAKMVQLGAPIENITAIDAILSELWAACGHVSYLRGQIADMSQGDLATPYGIMIVSLYDGERDRKVAIAALAVKAGVDEAAIRVAEVQVSLLGNALSKAADTAGLSAPMRKRLGNALREELQGVEARPMALNVAA